ncbi:hypothetical protein GCM10012275_36920 [Longimycelium tulufanense]|uniref:Methyltransferase type 11 domain-containing protein n=1 Tax=Longimycelium tulufanense TaxID=907463 RepID=A0A8J3CA10_9PSEU|nr:class I SAM-dependent methyltransferase [Longimycelium tulufanense]GGM62802.1 hypothetical protein GCM10012275_36920 [Longimycelium tulufanense]
MDSGRWHRYLRHYHEENAGVTERLFALLDASPYSWLVEPIRGREGPTLDLACGSAPTRDLLAGQRWVGVDVSFGELQRAIRNGRGPVVLAAAEALPLADNTIAAVSAAMCFPVFTDLDRVFAELHRVSRPGGLLTALVPSRLGPRLAGLRWLRLLRAIGVRDLSWPSPQARDGLPGLLHRAGWSIVDNERRVFRLEITDPPAADLLLDSLYLPEAHAEKLSQVRQRIRVCARPDWWLPLPLRRVVAQLPTKSP